jgi:hypothetical protein
MEKNLFRTVIFLTPFTLFGFIGNALLLDDKNEQNYEASVESWHNKRVNNLKKEHGWLSLIDLIWLNEGKNAIPLIGDITLENGKLFVALKKIFERLRLEKCLRLVLFSLRRTK